jgi:hypothetical protein
VSLGGRFDCQVVAVTNQELKCRTPGVAGALLAEYFALPQGTDTLPVWFGTGQHSPLLLDPLAPALGLVANLNLNWRQEGFQELGGVGDYIAVRLSGGVRIHTPGDYNFTCVADDICKVYVDGVQVSL